MKKSVLFLISIAPLFLQCACGGGSPPPINVQMSPAGLVLDVTQSASVTADAGSARNQGFDWVLSCGGGNCGTITAHTSSGAPATFTAPAAPLSTAVTITARLTGLPNSGTATAMVSTPPTVAISGPITASTLGIPYNLQLPATGGAGNLTWALAGGTSLPDTLSLSTAGVMTGTPSGTSGSFNFKVHVTDSGNPPVTSPDVQLSLKVTEPAIAVSLSQSSAFVGLNGSKNFIATVLYDQQNGNVDWTLTLNNMPCTVVECGSVSPATTASGAPTTYTAPANAPPANVTLTATTVDGTPPATNSAAITVTTHGFTATGSMVAARTGHTATLLGDGKVLITGGGLSSSELFDPTKGTFASTGNMGTTGGETATSLTNGKVLLTSIDGTAEIFDPAQGIFSATGSMKTARSAPTATLLKDGKVLLAGGADANGKPLLSAEIFDPAAGTFSPTGSLGTARSRHTATILQSGKVLIVGGVIPLTVTIQSSLGIQYINWQESLDSAEIFDPTSGIFSQTGNLGTPRMAHTATLLEDGKVLVTGGLEFTGRYGTKEATLSSAELFDPAIGSFAPAAAMATPRESHSATLRSDGTVLVAGGSLVPTRTAKDLESEQSIDSAELFDSKSGTFTQTGGMETPRSGHTATLLQDGRALVTGGSDVTTQSGKVLSTVLSTAELYQ